MESECWFDWHETLSWYSIMFACLFVVSLLRFSPKNRTTCLLPRTKRLTQQLKIPVEHKEPSLVIMNDINLDSLTLRIILHTIWVVCISDFVQYLILQINLCIFMYSDFFKALTGSSSRTMNSNIHHYAGKVSNVTDNNVRTLIVDIIKMNSREALNEHCHLCRRINAWLWNHLSWLLLQGM